MHDLLLVLVPLIVNTITLGLQCFLSRLDLLLIVFPFVQEYA